MIKRYSNVVFAGWDALRDAIKTLIANGTYKTLADIHAHRTRDQDGFVHATFRMHGQMYGPIGMRRFLPWHRAYLIAFERELQKLDSDLSVPYWDWHADAGQLIGFSNFLGLATSRDLGTLPNEPVDPNRPSWFVNENTHDEFTQYGGDYYIFTQALELGPHGAGHNWIGGDMANVMISPNDPAFWFHHAQVDRIWAKWQRINPGEMAAIHETEAELDPWENEFTVENVDDISNLGADSYEYVDP